MGRKTSVQASSYFRGLSERFGACEQALLGFSELDVLVSFVVFGAPTVRRDTMNLEDPQCHVGLVGGVAPASDRSRFNHPVDRRFKECLRWAAVVLFGGLGLRILFYDCLGALLSRPDIGASTFLICLLLGVSASATFLCAAWFCFRRQYHGLITVFAAIAAIGVFGALMSLNKLLLSALNEDFFFRPGETSWPGLLLGLAVSLLCLFGPFCATRWFFGWFECRCHRMAARWFGSRWCPDGLATV